MTTTIDPLDRVLSLLPGHREIGGSWRARCPAHADANPSLSVTLGDDGRVLIHCHAGCETDTVLAALGLKKADLFAPRTMAPSKNGKQNAPPKKLVQTYPYQDEHGETLYEVCRYHPKDFRQRCPDGKGGYVWSLKDVRRVPYRLPELLAADPTATVYIVEGEKDADRLVNLGLVATTNAQGAGKWGTIGRAFTRPLFRGRRVIILADNDDAGRLHVVDVDQDLNGHALVVGKYTFPDLPPKGDVSDWLDTVPDSWGPDEIAAELERLATRVSGDEPKADDEPNPLIANALDNTAFDEADFRREWLIDGILVRDEPNVLAGPSKSMKTGLIVDAAVSLAAGKPFLGRFPVPNKRRVYVISAESGPITLRDRMREVCKAKGVERIGLPIWWYTRVEALATVEGRQNLTAALQHFKSEVVFLDPGYLLLAGDAVEERAGSMYVMGPLLAAVQEACRVVGATLIIATHANGKLQMGRPMDLPDIAWSGYQQWARQWWLLSRRTEYQDDGRHAMYFRFGGSAGHTGLVHLNIDEGIVGPDGGRRWDVSAVEARVARREEQEAAEAEELGQIHQDSAEVLRVIVAVLAEGNEVVSRNKIEERTGLSRGKIARAVKKLTGDEAIVEATGRVKAGTGWKQSEGFRRPDGWSA